MRFDDPDALRRAGFTGFEIIAALRASRLASVPEEPGVYLVVRPAKSEPCFRDVNRAGRRRGPRNPTEPKALLHKDWVDTACVLYVGKAGGPGTRATLRSRLDRYLRQGLGHNAGHAGGSRIWQLDDAEALLVAWRPERERDPRDVELDLIKRFRDAHGIRPFANLRG